MRKTIEEQRFGRAVFLEDMGSDPAKGRMWKCECDCGTVFTARSRFLRSGKTQSCGCLMRDRVSERFTTHGMYLSNEYIVWAAAKQRCTNPKSPIFHHYGGRGITMCDRWLESFPAFFADMGPRPSPKHTIERRDNESGYCPENCVWATMSEQMSNTRRTRILDYDGKQLPLCEWAEIMGIDPMNLRSRLQSGWSVERALTTPVKTKKVAAPRVGSPTMTSVARITV